MPRAASPRSTPAEAHAAIEVLARLAALHAERRAQLAEGVGLSDPQWGVLEEIATEHFLPSLFAQKRESSAAAVSKLLRQLLDRGLVTSQAGESDGRQRRYSLTPAGRELMASLRAAREAAVRDVWLSLPAETVRAFSSSGLAIAARLEDYARSVRGKD